ncbi:MAG TPA: DUF2059 domain-containing protein [Candidatus Paceibacterota bacterium]
MASRERIDKLFEILNTRKQFDAVVSSTSTAIMEGHEADFFVLGIDPKEINRIVVETVGLLKEEMVELAAQIYAEMFNDEELGELIIIYSTPTYQKFLGLAPEINVKIVNFVVTNMDGVQALVKQRVSDLLTQAPPRMTRPRTTH